MSYTDPCGRCGNHRADCDCKEGYTPIAKKQTGIELIAKERQEQIERHGFNVANDEHYMGSQLLHAALFALTMNDDYYPNDWGNWWKDKMLIKDRTYPFPKRYVERLQIAGALIAAEIDRINHQPTDNQ